MVCDHIFANQGARHSLHVKPKLGAGVNESRKGVEKLLVLLAPSVVCHCANVWELNLLDDAAVFERVDPQGLVSVRHVCAHQLVLIDYECILEHLSLVRYQIPPLAGLRRG